MSGRFEHVSFAAKSDPGLQRTRNEDAFGAFPAYGVWCVADGMGGGQDGALASATAVRFVENYLRSFPPLDRASYAIDDVLDNVRDAVNEASEFLFDHTKRLGLKGCATTFACICLDGARPTAAFVLHAGDSRVYRLRDGVLRQVTKDHSLSEAMGVDESRLSCDLRSIITRGVGVESEVVLETSPVDLAEGDSILLCTDGLTRMVPADTIRAVLSSDGACDEQVASLVAAANGAGGVDNVTVEVLKLGKLPPESDTVEMRDEDRMNTVHVSDRVR
ncbi:MAG: PP2C family protein-serine/threonine phosphatase [Kiritimatiellia bacterium]